MRKIAATLSNCGDLLRAFGYRSYKDNNLLVLAGRATPYRMVITPKDWTIRSQDTRVGVRFTDCKGGGSFLYNKKSLIFSRPLFERRVAGRGNRLRKCLRWRAPAESKFCRLVNTFRR